MRLDSAVKILPSILPPEDEDAILCREASVFRDCSAASSLKGCGGVPLQANMSACTRRREQNAHTSWQVFTLLQLLSSGGVCRKRIRCVVGSPRHREACSQRASAAPAARSLTLRLTPSLEVPRAISHLTRRSCQDRCAAHAISSGHAASGKRPAGPSALR